MSIKQPANVLFANQTANLVTIDYNIGQLIGASNTVRTGAMNGRWPRQSQPRGICDISVGRLPLCHMAVFVTVLGPPGLGLDYPALDSGSHQHREQ